MVPVPPVGPKDVDGDETSGWHRAVVVLEGAETLVVAELPHPAKSRHGTMTIAKKSRRMVFRLDEHGRGAQRTLEL